jgi:hypothetical protein
MTIDAPAAEDLEAFEPPRLSRLRNRRKLHWLLIFISLKQDVSIVSSKKSSSSHENKEVLSMKSMIC